VSRVGRPKGVIPEMVGTDAVSGPMDPGLGDLPRLEKCSTGVAPVNPAQQRPDKPRRFPHLRPISQSPKSFLIRAAKPIPAPPSLTCPAMRLQVRFLGRVQGVGFRATTVSCAHGLLITGFVRNEPDGSVLMEAQGQEPDLNLLLARLAERMSRNITRVERIPLPDRPGEQGFTIQR